MRNPSQKKMHKGVRKLIYLGAWILIFTLYLIHSYNYLKGRSYIYEPVFISIEGSIPEGTSVELSYLSFNDPTIATKAVLYSKDSIPVSTCIFKTDSTFRLRNFSIYFKPLENDKEITISSIKASNADKEEFSYSLKPEDLIPSENLLLDPLSNGSIRIKNNPSGISSSSSLTFYASRLGDGVLVRTSLRDPEIPSLPALLGILILGICMAYSLYPVMLNLKWSGVSLGAYLLASSILILPSGERGSNLLLALAILAGFIKGLREGSLGIWLRENRRLLLVILVLVVIYLLIFLIYGSDPSTQKLLKIKYGLPMALLAVAFNTGNKQEIRIQYAALLSGVIISVFMHFGWTIMLIDAVELKRKLFSNPRYYMESAVFSRIHHSYLSILYLASLTTIFLKKDIITLRKREIIIFSLLIFSGLFFAFSRAALLSLILILGFFFLKRIFQFLNIEITRMAKFAAASVLTISLFTMVFINFRIDPASDDAQVRGLSTRVEIWENATDLIKQKPITGWGPGDYRSALNESNSSATFNSNTWRVLNTHNQFLETAGMFGLIAAIVLAWFLFFPGGFSRQKAIYSNLIFTAAIIFTTSFFFESILNRNLGVLVFGLSYGLLIKLKTIYGH
jgi:O-antigen ligase